MYLRGLNGAEGRYATLLLADAGDVTARLKPSAWAKVVEQSSLHAVGADAHRCSQRSQAVSASAVLVPIHGVSTASTSECLRVVTAN